MPRAFALRERTADDKPDRQPCAPLRGRSDRRTTRRICPEIKDKTREYAYVLDAAGRVLFCLKGERAAIRFDYRDRFRLSRTIFLHNHPLGSSFSLADIQAACVFDMRAILAVTKTRLFVLTPPGRDPFFTRGHYRDIARCYRIRSAMLPISAWQSATGSGMPFLWIWT